MRVTPLKRRKLIKRQLSKYKGFSGRKKNCNKIGYNVYIKSLVNRYKSNKLKKRYNKRNQIIVLNAAVRRMFSISYSKFMNLIKKDNIYNIYTMSTMAIEYPELFKNTYMKYIAC